jgi:hypothetical protein
VSADYYQFMITATVPSVYGEDGGPDTDHERAALWADLTDRIKTLLGQEPYRALKVEIVTDLRTYEE